MGEGIRRQVPVLVKKAGEASFLSAEADHVLGQIVQVRVFFSQAVFERASLDRFIGELGH